MCGIAGWIGRTTELLNSDVIIAMTAAIAHRGPDGEGIHRDETRDGQYQLELGHRRLAIIDLRSGAQPMQTPDGRAIVVYNGEIYNFQALRTELRQLGFAFSTSSDTEVLLQAYIAWGPEFVVRLRGMFAFALWDRAEQCLVLARDRFGKKPLFLLESGSRLIFGSEIKAVLAHPAVERTLDRESVLDYLVHRYVPGPYTLFAGIRKLSPGSYAVWQEGKLQEHQYFVPPDGHRRPSPASPISVVDRFVAKLDEAVSIRMISDVPFGAFLSGGIDSSAIVALMTRHSSLPINTFSVGFREEAFSELAHARQIAQHFRTSHHELVIHAGSLIDELPALIGFRDAPISEPSDIPIYLLSREASKSVKMVLTGEGSDEFLAGYPKHRFETLASLYQVLVPESFHRRLLDPLVASLPYGFRRVKTLVRSVGLRDATERFPSWFGALTRDQRDTLVALPHQSDRIDGRPYRVAAGTSALRRILYFDQTQWLPDNLLERGDRMTMAASIEARMPFMDHELSEELAQWPDSARLRGRTDKWVLRQAMRGVLPPSIIARKKVGFRVPVNEWFRGPMQDYVHEHLLGPSSRTRDYYYSKQLSSILEEHRSRRQNHEKLIWTLLNLELFQRQYGLSWRAT
jgi:asparagine synthase (glutamine-hydrolysing)